jgi:hypothetical protein
MSAVTILVIFLTVGLWYLSGKKHTLCYFFPAFLFSSFISEKNDTTSARRCVIFYHRHKKMILRRPTLCQRQNKNDTTSGRHRVIFLNRPKVRTKMTQCQLDIKSFLKTDLKSEKMTLRQLTLFRFKNRHKVRKKDTISGQHFWKTDVKSEHKWHNVGLLKFFLLIVSQFFCSKLISLNPKIYVF